MSKINFEESMERINEIVTKLEKNEVTLDESISLFEEGLKLIQTCDGVLKGFEEKVDTLMEEYKANDSN